MQTVGGTERDSIVTHSKSFALRSLFVVTFLAATGCAAFVYPTQLICEIAFTTIVGLLTAATLVAVFGAPQSRGLAGGFAIAGWIYLYVSQHWDEFTTGTVGSFSSMQVSLLTDRVIAFFAEVAPRSSQDPFDPHQHLERRFIGHMLFTLVVGIVGGSFSALVYRRAKPQ